MRDPFCDIVAQPEKLRQVKRLFKLMCAIVLYHPTATPKKEIDLKSNASVKQKKNNFMFYVIHKFGLE